jgi:hypothetical protein|tara:strand:- start:1438 stop:1662 length:225 start_codon:yes stop_codon:yes gene_type:complete
MEGHKIMSNTPYLDDKMEVVNFIETKMREGKANPKIRGWSMSTILKQVEESLGEKQVPFARDYFIRYYERSRKK